MANKTNKTLEQQIRDLEAQIEKLTKQADIEWPSREVGEKLEAKITGWFRNDEFFAGFRSTPARALITSFSVLILFGYGYYAFTNPAQTFWYLGLVCLVLMMQAISVRFVFNMDGSSTEKILDEYHRKRRNKALRRANKSYVNMMGLFLIAAFLYGYKDYFFGGKDLSFPEGADAVYNFSLSGWQFLVVAIFVLGWIALQKYWSYGIKGEPMLSREEARKLRDS